MLNDDFFEDETVVHVTDNDLKIHNGSNQNYSTPKYNTVSKKKDVDDTKKAMATLCFGILALVTFLFGINILCVIISMICGLSYLTQKHTRFKVLVVTGFVASGLSILLMIASYGYVINCSVGNTQKALEDALEYRRELNQLLEQPYDYEITLDDTTIDAPDTLDNMIVETL